MIIQSGQILAALTKKAQAHARDHSRHLLCPSCRVRTKLYALRDGRKKCSGCGMKFTPGKKTDAAKLKQYSELLLCFCLNFTAQQASDVSTYHYRLVASVYDRFRVLLASRNLVPGKMRLLMTIEDCGHAIHDSAFCRRCRGRFSCKGRKRGDAPIFGVKILGNKKIFIDPLREDEAHFRFDEPMKRESRKYSAYAGFICQGTFRRFTDNQRMKDGAERLWAWMSERLRKHHGIWKENAGLYLKELEWKYNNRLLSSETQAMKIVELMPADFLASWANKQKIHLDLVQKHS